MQCLTWLGGVVWMWQKKFSGQMFGPLVQFSTISNFQFSIFNFQQIFRFPMSSESIQNTSVSSLNRWNACSLSFSLFSERDYLYFCSLCQLKILYVVLDVLLWENNYCFSLSISFKGSRDKIGWIWWSDLRITFGCETASWWLLLSTGSWMWVGTPFFIITVDLSEVDVFPNFCITWFEGHWNSWISYISVIAEFNVANCSCRDTDELFWWLDWTDARFLLIL